MNSPGETTHLFHRANCAQNRIQFVPMHEIQLISIWWFLLGNQEKCTAFDGVSN
jgi:hypothetical protein